MQQPGTTLRHATLVLLALCIAVTLAHVRADAADDTAALFNSRVARDVDKATKAKLKHIIPLRFGKKWAGGYEDTPAAGMLRSAYGGGKPSEDGAEQSHSHRVHSKALPLIQLLQYAIQLMEEVIQGLDMEQGDMP
ncbi:PREDICTED: uncharacterized protein LOC109466202 [Branchiostoma belcheri]|uniref:Uncharacterized protein LOC109466202 n=1 Tax=Branchiostoma belcheri TaxID=7741 RepID=A0A6P4YQE1_BRABE|nr:PREDICTED: uncharacterized protein LOC109466202 [Branchiostoma belcheri]XP_019619431.1 PREDICTED: uncharacterized protein LOC109466202 [Branchiostoma belcheri]